MKILGIDPGLRLTGFGVIEKNGTRLSYVASGVIKTDNRDDLPTRIKTLFEGIAEITATHRPNHAAIEKVFVNVNPQSTLLLGQARGAAICALVQAQMPLSEYTALQIKKAVVGHGRAQKSQVQDMVKRLLMLAGTPKSDAADALGVAICHANTYDVVQSLQKAAQTQGSSTFRIRGRRLVG
ncbi:MAG: crossover junction endodeoxyribonuclease RuvC [Burkholderiaceae bacterium]|nr:crossover junction endodeoxyribonuclease RuvC [Burkholderiaceae bacterium]